MATKQRHRLSTEPVIIDVQSLTSQGCGTAHINDKAVLVSGALLGEKVEARYVRRRHIHELQAVSILTAASQRVDPGCDYVSSCGGCSLRHMDISAQLAHKESVLLDQLQQSTGLQPPDFKVMPRMTGETSHYRRKARLAVRLVAKKGGVLVGFREKYSSFVTVMSYCQVLSKEVAELIMPLRELVSGMDLAAEIPQIEVAVGESEIAMQVATEHSRSIASKQEEDDYSPAVVALVFRHLRPMTQADTVRLQTFAQAHQVELYLQPAGPESVHRLSPTGEDRLSYYLPEVGLHLKFHPLDFIQVNAGINRQLVNRVLELLRPDPTDRILDLFCGLGNFTLPLARHCASVLGVEGSETMVERGRENARLNQIVNAHFLSADLVKSETGDWWQGCYDRVLLDPPRSGALEIMPLLPRLQASKILYISCNSATLSRDATVLLGAGYKLYSVGVMDMFPHTAHVESMALFMAE